MKENYEKTKNSYLIVIRKTKAKKYILKKTKKKKYKLFLFLGLRRNMKIEKKRKYFHNFELKQKIIHKSFIRKTKALFMIIILISVIKFLFIFRSTYIEKNVIMLFLSAKNFIRKLRMIFLFVF